MSRFDEERRERIKQMDKQRKKYTVEDFENMSAKELSFLIGFLKPRIRGYRAGRKTTYFDGDVEELNSAANAIEKLVAYLEVLYAKKEKSANAI